MNSLLFTRLIKYVSFSIIIVVCIYIFMKRSRLFSTILFKIFLFLSSYIPLFIILAMQNYSESGIFIPLIILIITTVSTLYLFLDYQNKFQPNITINVSNVISQGSEAMNYVSGYIIAFLSLNAPIIENSKFSWINFATILILFIVIGNIYISNDLYYINPILSVLYNINEVESRNGENIIIITSKKNKLKSKTTIAIKQISDHIYYYK